MSGYVADLMTNSGGDTDSLDDDKARANWSGRFDFVVSCLGYVIGLGNVWRFPYLVYRNGGGTFFISYVLMLVFCGLPIMYLELAFGQYASLGPTAVWRSVPIFKGIGFSMVAVSAMVAIYYNVVITWSFFYFFTSMSSTLPWENCDNEWNTKECNTNTFNINCSRIDYTFVNQLFVEHSRCWNAMYNCSTDQTNIKGCINFNETTKASFNLTDLHVKHTSPSEEYFYNEVLDISDGITSIGNIRWKLALCLLLSWFIVFLSLLKGIKSSGKVSYLLVIFPFITILIILIRCLTIDGFREGIMFYLTPKWEHLKTIHVWSDAAQQVFFSLSASMGGLITLASYNKFHNNIYRDAVLIMSGDTLMSVMAGFSVFAVMGILAKELGTTVDKVIQSDVGLTFIVYPAAVNFFPGSSLWSTLFFLMICLMGLGTQIINVEVVMTALMDEKAKLLRKRRVLVLFIVCFILYLCGLPLTTQGGMFVLQLMDEHLGGFPTMTIAIFTCFAVGWVYGVQKFSADITHMIGSTVCLWWKVVWCLACPVIVGFILIFSIIDFNSMSHRFGLVKYPRWADGLGLALLILVLLPIPLYMIFKIFVTEGSIIERIRKCCKPDSLWGPASELWKAEYYPTVHTLSYPAQISNSQINLSTENVHFEKADHGLSISETNLIPSSPKHRKFLDMRQRAIINHAYSNPQCNNLGESSEKINRPYKPEYNLDDLIIVPRIKSSVESKNVSTQTNLSTLLGLSRSSITTESSVCSDNKSEELTMQVVEAEVTHL